ncbi:MULTISPECIES: class I SAM-dependent methyltransferase [unclassified Solwaraspora]|uniref:class I SAM-dependent methyltransferase n=1 Tax=unclassified Solwaraspora TaxID=2627926 RepID=UPI00259B396B|nr:class I SAM-dependent methyltransferase [Solwaraspora sp. WMMA2056]WJK41703.1 class I SAM-dependent methyltransferase [Solwaraspora sp. WMMA2056]
MTTERIPDQQPLWDAWHASGRSTGRYAGHQRLRQTFTERMTRLPAARRVLDVGCGQGHDMLAMAAAGWHVTGVDLSPEAIRLARARVPEQSGQPDAAATELHVHDIAAGLPFATGRFDGVYSHLALHYFTERTTQHVFDEIGRVLRPDGVLAFCVKSTADPNYGKGEQFGPRIFSVDGHVRHFFDEEYTRKLLTGWRIEMLDHYDGRFESGRSSAFIGVVATRADAG